MDATNGNDANPGTSRAQAWQTIGKVNGETFRPTDRILLKRGEEWREQLTIPSSGIIGKPITFSSYGSGAAPIINGADIITGWAAYGPGAGSTWQSALATECNQAFMDDVRLTEGADEDTLNDHEWIWVGNVLYVRDDTGDPDGSGVVIEASVRTYGIFADEKDNIVLDGFTVIYTNNHGITINGGSANLWNCICTYNYNINIVFSDAAVPVTSGQIINCTASYALVGQGVFIGIDLPDPVNIIVHGCLIHNNGIAGGDNGLYLNGASGCIIRYNAIYDNFANGMQLHTQSDDNEIYYNLIYGNGQNGLQISVAGGGDNNLIYNNTFYSHFNFSILLGDGSSNIFKNNNFHQIRAGWSFPVRVTGGHAVAQDQTWNYNSYYYPTSDTPGKIIEIDDNGGSTHYNLAEWQAYAGSPGANSISGNPLMTNPGADDFTLQAGSPCRNVGEDVGLTEDYAGVSVPQETNPAIGAYEYIA